MITAYFFNVQETWLGKQQLDNLSCLGVSRCLNLHLKWQTETITSIVA